MKQKTNLLPLLIAGLIAACMLTTAPAEAKIHRSQAAKDHFKASHPCPSNGNTRGACPGFVIDHVKPLDCGGADDPINMQWQSVAEGKAKDKWERDGCSISKAIRVKSPSPASSGNSYQTSPKGACFTYSASGKKRYVDHAFCR